VRDAKQILTALLEVLPPKKNTAWVASVLANKEKDEQNSDGDSFTPKNIIHKVNSICDTDTLSLPTSASIRCG
jgi:thiamine pyrophosphate-dependent acetolactate synthase large subunit-like protein